MKLAFTLIVVVATSTMAGADELGAARDFSMYPCPILSHVGIALVGIEQQRDGDDVLTFSIPKDMAWYVRAYVFELRDSSGNLLSTVRGSDAVVRKGTDNLAIGTLDFRTDRPISTEISVIETYPHGGCTFHEVEVGRAKLVSHEKPNT